MPTCAVKGCGNSSKKKFKMNCFPRNPAQRAVWIKNIGQKDWKPSEYSVLCEVHFAPQMWEKTRVDGKRKLKFNAIPTIFGDRMIEEPSDLQFKVSSATNIVAGNNIKSLNDASMKNLIPLNGAIIVNSQGKIINPQSSVISGIKSILKPLVKTVNSSPIVFSTNASILKNQIKVANNQTPIIIPATTSILKTQLQTSDSLNTENGTTTTQPILVPVTSAISNPETQMDSQLESQVSHAILKSHSITGGESFSTENLKTIGIDEIKNYQTTSTKSIILNKAYAKKIEDERFEKMDKLLLKQLKLNNALRKKLNLMSYKIQQLMKEQNTDGKAFLEDVFTEDQIKALESRYSNPKSKPTWSYKTMMKAIKLKQECGTRGYEELLNQNLPFPSVRTITRWCTARNIPIP